jgi:hypothetical protein
MFQLNSETQGLLFRTDTNVGFGCALMASFLPYRNDIQRRRQEDVGTPLFLTPYLKAGKVKVRQNRKSYRILCNFLFKSLIGDVMKCHIASKGR